VVDDSTGQSNLVNEELSKTKVGGYKGVVEADRGRGQVAASAPVIPSFRCKRYSTFVIKVRGICCCADDGC
jgi:hypothetical protein